MHSQETFEAVVGLCDFGLNDCQVSRLIGLPRGTVRYMRVTGRKGWDARGTDAGNCPICGTRSLDEEAYAQLLGLYLGDGCIATQPRNVYRLRISLDQKYLIIVAECIEVVERVRALNPGPAGVAEREGLFEDYCYWKHWPCLFPQHGVGPKWKRGIKLEPWQESIVRQHPDRLIRGLIHSDGSRDLNWVNGRSYPRYQFCNFSYEIQEIFTDACERLGVHWTRPYWKTIAVARRPSVAILDALVGPKV